MQWNCPKRCYCIIKLERNNNRTDRLFARRLATIYALSRSMTRIRWIPALIGFQNAHLCQQPSKYADVHTCTTVDTGRGWSSAFPAREVKGEGAWGGRGAEQILMEVEKILKAIPPRWCSLCFAAFPRDRAFQVFDKHRCFHWFSISRVDHLFHPFSFFFTLFFVTLFFGGEEEEISLAVPVVPLRVYLYNTAITLFFN